MKTVKFLKTVERRRHGAEQVFEEGQKYTLSDDLADHYTRRGLAVEVGGKAAEKPAPAGSTESSTDGDPMGSSQDVGGSDGAGAGQRAKPAGKPAGSGKGGGKRKG